MQAPSLLLLMITFPGLPLEGQVGTPELGTYALSFGFLSSGDGAIGVRKMVRPNANAGLNLTLLFDHRELKRSNGPDEGDSQWGIGITPDIRLYRNPRGNVLPFLDLNAGLSFHGHDGGSWTGRASTGAGIGAEWFPVASMSVSGKTGLIVYYDWTEVGSSDDTERAYSIATRTSSLSVNLYF